MANNSSAEKQRAQELVCVTGAGGFIGSWAVKELLLCGYRVRGTARDPADSKNVHLHTLEGADERLSLRRADVLDYDSLCAAFDGCHGVFHVASPVSNDVNYYCCAKMMAEMAATEEATRRGLQLAVVVPPMTIGPMLQQSLNVSNYHVARYLMGTKKAYPNAVAIYADVRDVVHAHLLVYERHHAGGPYLCFGMALHRSFLLRLLRDLFPHYPITSKCEENDKPMASRYRFPNQRLEDLGLEFTDMRRTLYETVICLQQKGHVRIIVPYQRSSL